jgi:hypothetical protein
MRYAADVSVDAHKQVASAHGGLPWPNTTPPPAADALPGVVQPEGGSWRLERTAPTNTRLVLCPVAGSGRVLVSANPLLCGRVCSGVCV